MSLCSLPVFITHAGRRHDNDAAAAVHPGGDGPSADGEESVQRETDGAAGGRPVDRNDQVDAALKSSLSFSSLLLLYVLIYLLLCDVVLFLGFILSLTFLNFASFVFSF